jgi:hypothetical protein
MTTEGGTVELSGLAAAMAHREETAQIGLAWLEAKGHVVLLEERHDTVRLAPGDGAVSQDLPEIGERLRALLAETRAYRAYVARADAQALINSAVAD